ncbi:M57 family metalloprotease [Jidongwangia harbinensis]|uniref:M57 family metalloprotease n=1 Tax=Jidongwangia harbinensis TaxID=2878561 RepID=UPI001CD99968|nr:M57 family metalloprotease [Jidongwangia harbinensis]MCA2219246.1 M57 family metalloprotease [Jidongwangia harbinensis]
MIATGRSSRGTVARFTGALLAVAVILGMAGSPASATNFGSTGTPGTDGITNGVWFTPDRFWNVGLMSLEPDRNLPALRASVEDDYNVTDLDAFAITGSCAAASHDACVFDTPYGRNGVNGWNACAGTVSGSHPNQTCSLSYVRLNQTYTWDVNNLACHELGHAVGLRHSTETSSCMFAAASPATITTTHDRGHLNTRY